MLRKGLNPEIVAGLSKSFKVLRPVYPIVKAEDGEILDGYHRREAAPITYEKYCVTLKGVKSKKDKLLYRMHLNYRRKVTKAERRKQLTRLAEILEKEGISRRDMVTELAKITPFRERWIRELLPEKFKMVERAPKPEAAVMPHIEKLKPEVKVIKAPETWEYRKARMQPPVSKMDDAVFLELQREGWDVEFQIEYCIRSTTVDVKVNTTPDGRKVNSAVYLDGEEAHKGREDRDEMLRELLAKRHGLRVVSIPYKRYSESALREVMDRIREEFE